MIQPNISEFSCIHIPKHVASLQVEMDGPRFAKLCRETGVQAGRLNSVAVDIIFSSVKTKVSTVLSSCPPPVAFLPRR